MGGVQKRLDLGNIRLGDQIDLQNELFSGISRDELQSSTGNLDIQGGIHWNSEFTERVKLYAGYAMFHILEPTQSFGGANLSLPRRNVSQQAVSLACLIVLVCCLHLFICLREM